MTTLTIMAPTRRNTQDLIKSAEANTSAPALGASERACESAWDHREVTVITVDGHLNPRSQSNPSRG